MLRPEYGCDRADQSATLAGDLYPTPPLLPLKHLPVLLYQRALHRHQPIRDALHYGISVLDTEADVVEPQGCQLQGSGFKEARVGDARLHQAEVQGSCFQRALLWGADLSGLKAEQSFWQEADLSGSRLQGARFNQALMHRACLQGVVAGGSSRRQARLVEADFRSGLDQLTDLGEADFRDADLSFASFQGANLQVANLQQACFYGTNLRGCDLRRANLRGCDLREAQLDGAQLEGADLQGAMVVDCPQDEPGLDAVDHQKDHRFRTVE